MKGFRTFLYTLMRLQRIETDFQVSLQEEEKDIDVNL